MGKPGREYFEAALAELGARPDEATMIDSIADLPGWLRARSPAGQE